MCNCKICDPFRVNCMCLTDKEAEIVIGMRIMAYLKEFIGECVTLNYISALQKECQDKFCSAYDFECQLKLDNYEIKVDVSKRGRKCY